MKNIQYVRLSRVRSPCLCKPLFILGFKVEISYSSGLRRSRCLGVRGDSAAGRVWSLGFRAGS